MTRKAKKQPQPEPRVLRILNLGAGVQSTALYIMSCEGHAGVPRFDAAYFADTQEEPAEVYRHLQWMQRTYGHIVPIYIGTKGKLGDHLLVGQNSTGQRFATIPAFVKNPKTGKKGKMRRQCSKEYKIEVIERGIRRDIVGLQPRQRVPKHIEIHQYIGISLDEAGRAARIRENWRKQKRGVAGVELPAGVRPQYHVHFPLLDLNWTRAACVSYLSSIVPHDVPRSACTFCPFHNDHEWLQLRANDPEGWARAVQIDHALRQPGTVMNRNMDGELYLHESLVPLDQVVFRQAETPLQAERAHRLGNVRFAEECLGVCGN